jgi:hypothetical protein
MDLKLLGMVKKSLGMSKILKSVGNSIEFKLLWKLKEKKIIRHTISMEVKGFGVKDIEFIMKVKGIEIIRKHKDIVFIWEGKIIEIICKAMILKSLWKSKSPEMRTR